MIRDVCTSVVAGKLVGTPSGKANFIDSFFSECQLLRKEFAPTGANSFLQE